MKKNHTRMVSVAGWFALSASLTVSAHAFLTSPDVEGCLKDATGGLYHVYEDGRVRSSNSLRSVYGGCVNQKTENLLSEMPITGLLGDSKYKLGAGFPVGVEGHIFFLNRVRN